MGFNWVGGLAGALGAGGQIAFKMADERQALEQRKYEEEQQRRREEAQLVRQEALMKYGYDMERSGRDSQYVDEDGIPITNGELDAMTPDEKVRLIPLAKWKEMEEDKDWEKGKKRKIDEWDDPELRRIREEEDERDISKESKRRGILSADDEGKEAKREERKAAREKAADEETAANLGMTYEQYRAEKARSGLYGKGGRGDNTEDAKLRRDAYREATTIVLGDEGIEATPEQEKQIDRKAKALYQSWRGEAPAEEPEPTAGDVINDLLGNARKTDPGLLSAHARGARPSPLTDKEGGARRAKEADERKAKEKETMETLAAEKSALLKIPWSQRTPEQKARLAELRQLLN